MASVSVLAASTSPRIADDRGVLSFALAQKRPGLGVGGQPVPLSIHPSGRYLVDGQGAPFLVIGDTPWSLPINCTDAQIDSYLDDREAKGCTAILFELIERAYSSQTPKYRNAYGNDPFTVMSPVNWTLAEAYWQHIDYVINAAEARGIVSFVTPAYTGYGSGSDGWLADYSGASNATLHAYGAALASRYAGKPIVWVMGGDDANDAEAAGDYGSGTAPNRTKQWQIALGILSVHPGAIITGHTARNGTGTVSGEAYRAWTSGYTGFGLNNIYGHDNIDDAPSLAASAYGRAGYPFFLIEAGYENTDGNDIGGVVPAIQSVLGGGLVGWFGGHDALWHMGSYDPNTGAASVLSAYLAGSWLAHANFGALLRAYEWWKLEPQTGTTLVTTSLGTGADTICPALASDGAFALIWAPFGANFTVDLSAFSVGSVRARWWRYDDGTFTTASGSPYSNSGTQAFSTPGYRILVLDAE